MSVNIGGIAVEAIITQPQCDITNRSRSVVYALDGTAKEDRLGPYKKSLTITFGILSSEKWEALKAQLKQKVISVTGNIATLSINGYYRMLEDTIPTPVLFLTDGMYYCQPFSIVLEEI